MENGRNTSKEVKEKMLANKMSQADNCRQIIGRKSYRAPIIPRGQGDRINDLEP